MGEGTSGEEKGRGPVKSERVFIGVDKRAGYHPRPHRLLDMRATRALWLTGPVRAVRHVRHVGPTVALGRPRLARKSGCPAISCGAAIRGWRRHETASGARVLSCHLK